MTCLSVFHVQNAGHTPGNSVANYHLHEPRIARGAAQWCQHVLFGCVHHLCRYSRDGELLHASHHIDGALSRALRQACCPLQLKEYRTGPEGFRTEKKEGQFLSGGTVLNAK